MFHYLFSQRSLKEIAELYGSDLSLDAVQEYRSRSGVESLTAKCLKSAKIAALVIDDGLELDKKYEIEWHKAFVPFVGRILRIEHVAEKILNEVRYTKYTISFSFIFQSFFFHMVLNSLCIKYRYLQLFNSFCGQIHLEVKRIMLVI